MAAPATPTFTTGELDRASAWLADGGVLVCPTESFYALAADPRSPAAVDEVLRLKKRAHGHPLPLLAGDRPQVELAAPGWESVDASRRLADRFWPGPLALVLRGVRGFAPGAVGEDGSIAIRVSAHPLAAGLARRFGFPITATSANRSGARPSVDPLEARQSLPQSAILAVIDGGKVPGGAPSTIIDARSGTARILRAGAIGLDEIAGAGSGTRS